MLYAEKGNKVVSINPDQSQYYLDRGFDIKDDNGVVQRAKANDLAFLEKLCDELKAENDALKAEIASLKAKKPAKAPVQTESEVVDTLVKTPRKASK